MVTQVQFVRSVAFAAAVWIGAALLASSPAQAGKVHWKENPASPGCFALAFDDTNEWFATAKGVPFKKGVCHGQSIQYEVDLAQDGESFTVSGANVCEFQVGNGHAISAACHPHRTH